MNYIYVVLLLGFVILAHEFGHFLAAKLTGIPVKIFSIGFGPRMIKLVRGGTEYRISWFPVGGYVLPDIEDEKEFFKLPVFKRIIMTMGGPMASLMLTVLCFAAKSTFLHGISFMNIFVAPIQNTYTLMINFITTVPMLFTHADQLSGVVGIISQGGQFIGLNPLNLFSFMALLSLNLFVLNLIPIPVLDGGKLLLYILEKINSKSVKLQFPLSVAGWIFILGLMVYVTIMDIGKIVM